MWKYIVTWVVLHYTVTPCEHKDQFGRKVEDCKKQHWSYPAEPMRKEFTDREEFKAFYLDLSIAEYEFDKAGEKSFGDGFDNAIGRIKIDSVYVNSSNSN